MITEAEYIRYLQAGNLDHLDPARIQEFKRRVCVRFVDWVKTHHKNEPLRRKLIEEFILGEGVSY